MRALSQGSGALIGCLRIQALPTNHEKARTFCCTYSRYKILRSDMPSDKNVLRKRACVHPYAVRSTAKSSKAPLYRNATMQFSIYHFFEVAPLCRHFVPFARKSHGDDTWRAGPRPGAGTPRVVTPCVGGRTLLYCTPTSPPSAPMQQRHVPPRPRRPIAAAGATRRRAPWRAPRATLADAARSAPGEPAPARADVGRAAARPPPLQCRGGTTSG